MSDATVVFPETLFRALLITINAHRDSREAVLKLFGISHTSPARTHLVPFALVGHGVDRIRRTSVCGVDLPMKLLEIEGFGAEYPGRPELVWGELGNIHRHPRGMPHPSAGDIASALASLAELPPALSLHLIGILEPTDCEPVLRTYSVDRAGRCVRIPWSTAPLPTLADPARPDRRGWIDRPVLRALLTRITGARGTPQADGGLAFPGYRIPPTTM